MKMSLFNRFYSIVPRDFAASRKSNPDSPATRGEALDLIMQIYGEVRAYDLHYSTTRSALTTFIAGLAVSIVPLILSKALVEDQRIPIATFELLAGGGFLVSLALLIAALFISVHFQSLTYACEKYQSVLEHELESLVANGRFDVTRLKFREQLKNLTTRRWWSDPPQKCLILVIIFQLTFAIASFTFFRTQSACLREKSTGRVERCLYDKLFGSPVLKKLPPPPTAVP